MLPTRLQSAITLSMWSITAASTITIGVMSMTLARNHNGNPINQMTIGILTLVGLIIILIAAIAADKCLTCIYSIFNTKSIKRNQSLYLHTNRTRIEDEDDAA